MKLITNLKNNQNKIKKITLAFMIPTIILMFVYYRLEITPFGNRSLFTIDLKNQYISFFSYLKSSLMGQDSLLYSFSKTMSGNMVGLVGYYLVSPFNILFLFADVSNFHIVLTFITLLKTGAAALTMYIYLNSKNTQPYLIYALSTAYSLSSYMITYQQNIMWLDAVILLPIVILGIDNIFKKKTTYVYILSLAITIMTNYYIGYMVCIFSVLYFIASILKFSYGDKSKQNKIPSLIGKFILASLIAGGISSIVWIPSLLSYSGSSKVAFEGKEIFDFNSNFSLIDFLSKFVIGSTNPDQIQNGLPNIFVPTSLLILGILFFFNKKINIEQKLKYGFLLVTMYLSFKYVGINKIWHGFSEPTWFPYRNSFIFIFLVICIIAIQIKYFSVSFYQLIIVLVVNLFTLIDINNLEFNYLTDENIHMTFIVCMITIILIGLAVDKKIKLKYIMSGLLVISIFETAQNSYLILEENNYYDAYEYESFVKNTKPIVEDYKPEQDDFYRLEKTFSYNENDPMLLNYAGLSHYSSNESDRVKEFLGNLGYRNNGNWSIYSNGSSWFADSLLGVKYVISDDIPKNYLNKVEEVKEFDVYHNPYAFPLGFLVKDNQLTASIEYENTFQYQNELINKLFGMDDVYQEISEENITIDISNLEYRNENNKHVFSKVNAEEDAYVLINIAGFEPNDQLNVFFNNDKFDSTSGELYFDNQYYGKVLSLKENNIYTYNPQENHVEVKIKLLNDTVEFTESLFYSNDISQIQELYNKSNNNKLDIVDFSPIYIQGIVPSQDSTSVMNLTIPYDEGWKAYVDGNSVDTFTINGIFLGVEIPKESTNLELKFIPKGLKLSLIICIVSIGTVGYIIFKEKRKE